MVTAELAAATISTARRHLTDGARGSRQSRFMPVYTGPRRRVSLADLPALERRYLVAERKVDGWYCELEVGDLPRLGTSPARADGAYDRRYFRGQRRSGVITSGRLRSGRALSGVAGAELLGRVTPWPSGTVVACEVMTATDEARRWRETNNVSGGAVVFDLLFFGGEDWRPFPNAARREQLEAMFRLIDGRAARALQLVERTHRIRDLYRSVVDQGLEGIVVVDPRAVAGQGKWKVKRSDAVTCSVVRVEDRSVTLVAGSVGEPFSLSPGKLELAVGDLVDVEAVGFSVWNTPRHARIVRRRDDLRPVQARDFLARSAG
jgi:hypothetical protein